MKSKFGNIIKNTKLNVNDIPQTNCTCEEDCKLKIEENQNQNQTIKHPLKEGESSNIEENRSQIDLEDTNVNIIIMKEDIIPINLISNSYNKSTIADLLQKNLEEEDNEDHECERDRNHNDNKYGNDLHKKKRLTQKIMTNSDNEDDSDANKENIANNTEITNNINSNTKIKRKYERKNPLVLLTKDELKEKRRQNYDKQVIRKREREVEEMASKHKEVKIELSSEKSFEFDDKQIKELKEKEVIFQNSIKELKHIIVYKMKIPSNYIKLNLFRQY